MKLNFKIWFGLLAGALLLGGCEKNLNPEDLGYTKELVVNALFQQSNTMMVYLGYTLPHPGSQVPVPENASVAIYEDGVFKEQLSFLEKDSVTGMGLFRPGFKAKPGKSYTIKAYADGMPEASGTTLVPVVPELSGLSFQVVEDPDTSIEFQFNVTGIEAQGHEHYIIKAYLKYTVPILDSITGDTVLYIETKNASLNITDAEKVSSNVYYLENPAQAGNSRTIKGKINWTDLPIPYQLELIADVRNSSDEYYLYQKSLNAYFSSQYDLNDPVFVYSNIRGGKGIVAAYTIKTQIIKIH